MCVKVGNPINFIIYSINYIYIINKFGKKTPLYDLSFAKMSMVPFMKEAIVELIILLCKDIITTT